MNEDNRLIDNTVEISLNNRRYIFIYACSNVRTWIVIYATVDASLSYEVQNVSV